VKKKVRRIAIPGKYRPNSFARIYMWHCPEGPFQAKKTADWAFLYFKRKLVWNCNLTFFKAHFTKDKESK
jgi:hypothetical protein